MLANKIVFGVACFFALALIPCIQKNFQQGKNGNSHNSSLDNKGKSKKKQSQKAPCIKASRDCGIGKIHVRYKPAKINGNPKKSFSADLRLLITKSGNCGLEGQTIALESTAGSFYGKNPLKLTLSRRDDRVGFNGDGSVFVSLRQDFPAGTTGKVLTSAVTEDNRHFIGCLFIKGETPPPLAPDLIDLEPWEGTQAGGSAVTLSGRNFVSGATVFFGEGAALDVQVLSSQSISCQTPPSDEPGLVDVKVLNPDGQHATLEEAFEYLPLPQVLNIFPTSGALAGNTPVWIVGKYFRDPGISSVKFGNLACIHFTILGDTLLLAYSPAQTVGTQSIRVEGEFGASVDSPADDFNYVSEAGNVSFGPIFEYEAAPAVLSVLTADFDQDGKTDIFAAGTGAMAYKNTSSGNGNISFEVLSQMESPANPFGITLGDFNNDGLPDVACVGTQTNATINVFLNTSADGTISFDLLTYFIDPFWPRDLCCGDFDNDGLTDIAFVDGANIIMGVMRNLGVEDGALSMSMPVAYALTGSPRGMTCFDIDGDGLTDIVSADSFANKVSVFRNMTLEPGSIALSNPVILQTPDKAWDMCWGDFNNDGKPDLAGANAQARVISVFPNLSNSGSIAFGNRYDLQISNGPIGICVTDLDADGRLDLATANLNSGTMSLIRNISSNGNVAFQQMPNLLIPTQAWPVAAGDFDGDGRMDLTGTSATNESMFVFQNLSMAESGE